MSSRYPEEVVTAARDLYLRHVPVRDIRTMLGINSERVIYQWIEKHGWEDLIEDETPEQAISRRLIKLSAKEIKTDADFKEMSQLSNLLLKLADVDLKKAKTAKEKALAAAPAIQERGKSASGRGRKGKGKTSKNDVGQITPEQLETVRQELFFDYQHRWFDNKHHRTRFILKSRQIGATYYFAWEAFQDAIVTGNNQCFLSASRNQAEIFKAYIIHFALQYFDLELKGTGDGVIGLSKDGKPWAEFRFMSTNGRTVQGYHGHLYVDEVFWIPDFEKLNKVSSGIAAHKKWRRTYFSTPSIKSHGAYPLWSGEKYNDSRKNKVKFDITHESLKDGAVGPDKIWRNIVTVKDAEERGCDLFDIEQLQDEYSENEFNNLFMCAFMEAGLSAFRLDDLLNCAVDSDVVWLDFKTKTKRPFGNTPVWVGYDPARYGDRSTVVVVAPPLKEGGKFRVLEKIPLKGGFTYQASQIKNLLEKYNVQFIGIDCTGPGLGVYEQVKDFYPRTTAIHYGLETKTRLVEKAKDVIEYNRIEWDAEHTDIPQAFLQIQQATTKGDHITYIADRNSETGHADVAFAIMHALSNEPLSGKRRTATVAFG